MEQEKITGDLSVRVYAGSCVSFCFLDDGDEREYLL